MTECNDGSMNCIRKFLYWNGSWVIYGAVGFIVTTFLILSGVKH